jgi:D-serine deaminase-like pyridoxal phosphate-dependent protein
VKANDIRNLDSVPSPSLLVFPGRIERNIRKMLAMVGGDATRLRPHVKTHKMKEVILMQVEAGITQFKCATLAEMEMTASSGGKDILFAYQPVGPNIDGFLRLQEHFADVNFSMVVDSLEIARAFDAAGKHVNLFLDIDCGMHRTGIEPGTEALAICRAIRESQNLQFAGLHVYDGHIHDADLDDRANAHLSSLKTWSGFLDQLREEGLEPPTIVTGGSPTFALFARTEWQCSPGTTLLWDAGYGSAYPDLGFEIAAMLLSRVVSKPGGNRICLDLGHKAVAGENPLEQRIVIPGLPDAVPVMHSEEHLVMEVPDAHSIDIGTGFLATPWHICPTVALHDKAHVVRDGTATGEIWEVTARNRLTSI